MPLRAPRDRPRSPRRARRRRRVSDAKAAAPAAIGRAWPDRVLAALPLAIVFFWLCFLYAWESWGHVTPWLFSDEIKLAEISRTIAATGHPGAHQPGFFNTLYAYVLAPAWLVQGRAHGLRGREVHRRDHDGVGLLPRLRDRAPRLVTLARALRRDRGGGDPRPRLLPDVPARAARVPVRDARPLPRDEGAADAAAGAGSRPRSSPRSSRR